MPRLQVRLYLTLTTINALLTGACHFSAEKLTQQACSAAQPCTASGTTCCSGYCVKKETCPQHTQGDSGPDLALVDLSQDHGLDPSIDSDRDNVRNDSDNCPNTANATQLDSDKDGVGDVCDCAAEDKFFSEMIFSSSKSNGTDPFLLVPMEQPNDWQTNNGLFRQVSTDNLHRAIFEKTEQGATRVTLRVIIHGAGDDGLAAPAQNISAAGAIVRAQNTTSSSGTGYYCGIDYANFRLVLAKTEATDIGEKNLQLFANPLSEPGVPISRGLNFETVYVLAFRAVGSTLFCELTHPDQSKIEVTATDNAFVTGDLGVFTAGASATFHSIKLCKGTTTP